MIITYCVFLIKSCFIKLVILSVLERVRTRTRTQWVSPSPSPDSSPDLDSTLVDSDSDSDSTSVDSDSSDVDSDSGLMDSDSDSDSTQVDSDSQWVQVSPVRNVHGKFKLSCAIMDEIRGRYWLTLKWSRHWALPLVVKGGSIWTLTQKTHFPKKFFWPKSVYIKTTLKH